MDGCFTCQQTATQHLISTWRKTIHSSSSCSYLYHKNGLKIRNFWILTRGSIVAYRFWFELVTDTTVWCLWKVSPDPHSSFPDFLWMRRLRHWTELQNPEPVYCQSFIKEKKNFSSFLSLEGTIAHSLHADLVHCGFIANIWSQTNGSLLIWLCDCLQ